MYKSDDDMYSRLHSALNKSDGFSLSEDKLRQIHARLAWKLPDDPVALFVERVEQSGGTSFVCNTRNEMAVEISGLINEHGIESVALEDSEDFRQTGIIEIFQSAGCNTKFITEVAPGKNTPDEIKSCLASTDAGVTTVSAGFADCGAVFSEPGPGKARLMSELTNVHIAILRKSDIYPSMTEYAERLSEQLAKGNVSAHTFIGGPSKTADIEKTLVQGVHGPRVFAVMILDDPLLSPAD